MKEFYYSYFPSPLGDIEIKCDDNHIFSFWFINNGDLKKEAVSGDTSLIIEAKKQFKQYFEGTLKQFDLPLQPEGTDFQKRVWAELAAIPFGKTASYLQMAKQLGDEKCIRAAASANGKNPFSIVIPCHRVIGTDGSLTGYAGKLWRKQWLLDHEAKVCGSYNKLF